MKPFGIPGIVVVMERRGSWYDYGFGAAGLEHRKVQGRVFDAVCDAKYYMSLGLEKHNGIWRACDSATSEVLAAGRSSRATLKAALLRWRQEIDAEEDDEA